MSFTENSVQYPIRSLRKRYTVLNPMKNNKDFREVFKPMKDELTEYLNNKYKGKFKEEEN